MRRVLVVEADETIRRELILGLRGSGIEADGVADVSAAGPALASGDPGAVVLGPAAVPDLALLTGPGVATMVVVMISGDTAAGLRAIRGGADDFVPATAGVEALAVALRKVEARRAFAPPPDRAGGPAPGDVVPRASAARAGSPALVGGAKMAAVLARVRRLAGVSSGILVGGESGTGKELIAWALHDLSPWRSGPFVPVNCGAIPSGLIESELFGHVRGAFTDAVRDKRGLFEVADGGTLFLDEIADLPLQLQAKLLRVLQDGIIHRVGDTDDLHVRVRVVAATARDLLAEVRAGRFREDLYYRLSGLDIQLPPLRDRPEDIPLLAQHFLARAVARLGLPPRQIDPEAMRLLGQYSWPGNVRELENTIERAAVLCGEDRIDVASLPERLISSVPSPSPGIAPGGGAFGPLVGPPDGPDGLELSIKRASRKAEESLIRVALARTGGNRARAALLLEISHRALLYKIKDYGIVVGVPKRNGSPKGASTD